MSQVTWCTHLSGIFHRVFMWWRRLRRDISDPLYVLIWNILNMSLLKQSYNYFTRILFSDYQVLLAVLYKLGLGATSLESLRLVEDTFHVSLQSSYSAVLSCSCSAVWLLILFLWSTNHSWGSVLLGFGCKCPTSPNVPSSVELNTNRVLRNALLWGEISVRWKE